MSYQLRHNALQVLNSNHFRLVTLSFNYNYNILSYINIGYYYTVL